MPKVGEVIAERYELLAHLGDGGSASVWKASDRTLEREVAIKFLYVADERDADVLRKQFLREARIACAVKHRNVIQTVDFGQTDEGRAYMVMELLRGEELTRRIGAQTDLGFEETVEIIAGVLRGLQAIHEAGIVHRDVKPENIYLERDQDGLFPKILDFGIAKSIDRRGNRRSVLTTKEGIVVGTPEYMSPEQARGQRDLDARADVWSVGVLLFELLTGKLPFDEPSEAEVIIKIVTTDAPKAAVIRPGVPASLSDVADKALRRDRALRFQSAAEMNQALQEAAKALREAEQSNAPAAAQRRRKTQALVLGSAVLGLLLLWVLFSRERPAQSAARLEPAKSPTVTVELHGVPSSAAVSVNGKLVAGTKLTLPNDGHSRLIEVQVPGRNPWRVMHPAGNDANYEVRTSPVQAPPAAVNELTRTSGSAETRPAQSTTAPRDEHNAARTKASHAASNQQEPAGKAPGAAIAPSPSEHKAVDRPGKTSAPKPRTVWRKLDF
jgi:serine/threonine protein kinase